MKPFEKRIEIKKSNKALIEINLGDESIIKEPVMQFKTDTVSSACLVLFLLAIGLMEILAKITIGAMKSMNWFYTYFNISSYYNTAITAAAIGSTILALYAMYKIFTMQIPPKDKK